MNIQIVSIIICYREKLKARARAKLIVSRFEITMIDHFDIRELAR